ncbi:hypothetical protein DNTS_029287 [Danionella cerebrum]|uniref:CARD domain-containing protein n=1 Tax=Danionella cerebrum TaxID=2873325 RepID=A0A553RP47_9TELE|nr:hypothetical protein DNTS_029287 [Danionella translucida]
MGSTNFTNPYAIEVIRAKQKELVRGIMNTEDLVDLLIANGVLQAGSQTLISSIPEREEKNLKMLKILISRGERACRIFFYPCLKQVEPEIYQHVRAYVGGVNNGMRDARRQLIGYLLQKDKQGPKSIKELNPYVLEKSTPSKQMPKSEGDLDPFRKAISSGDIHLLQELIKDLDVNSVRSSNDPLLHLAAEHGKEAILFFLLREGAQLDLKDGEGRTALHRASESGHTAVVQALLKAGADLHAADQRPKPSLHLAAELGHENTVNALVLEERRSLTNQTTNEINAALFKAVQRNLDEVAASLIDHGAEVNDSNELGYTPMLLAAELGNTETFKVLLSKKARLDVRLPNQISSLHLAVRSGSLQIAQILLNNGIDPDISGCNDQTPLHLCAKHNQLALMALLLRHGAQINCTTREGFTPLHLATQSGHIEAVTKLLEGNADMHLKDKQGRAALHWAAAQGEVPIIEALLDAGADANTTDKERKSPLHLAAIEGHAKAISALLDGEAKVGAKEMDGCSALHYAAQNGKRGAAAVLLASNKSKNVDERNVWRRTPLHLAAEHGHEMLVSLLLENGARINAMDNNKDTPLHCACRNGHLETVKVLINWTNGERAKIHVINNVKKTALQVAEAEDTETHQNICMLLKRKLFLVK